ncbi:hypothetical protein SAURM35S_09556 [Streptomyces aurantiogriseus]
MRSRHVGAQLAQGIDHYLPIQMRKRALQSRGRTCHKFTEVGKPHDTGQENRGFPHGESVAKGEGIRQVPFRR